MLNITTICKRFGKLPGHFKGNGSKDKSLFGTETVGRAQHTTIADELIPDFLLWLSRGHNGKNVPEIRTILATKGIEATLEFVRMYEAK